MARHLAASTPLPPTDAHLRRAVSTAYYAVFHKVASAGAELFAGRSRRGAYSIIHRSFEHGRIKKACEGSGAKKLGENYQRRMGRSAVSADARSFATMLGRLQNERNRADYDPIAMFTLADALDIVDLASDAIAAFDAIKSDEQADILALMQSPDRS